MEVTPEKLEVKERESLDNRLNGRLKMKISVYPNIIGNKIFLERTEGTHISDFKSYVPDHMFLKNFIMNCCLTDIENEREEDLG